MYMQGRLLGVIVDMLPGVTAETRRIKGDREDGGTIKKGRAVQVI